MRINNLQLYKKTRTPPTRTESYAKEMDIDELAQSSIKQLIIEIKSEFTDQTEEDQEKLMNSASFIIFSQSLNECLKNSIDAGAQYCDICLFSFNQYTIMFKITDNGHGFVREKLGPYLPDTSRQSPSAKKGKELLFGGCKVALIRTATCLIKHGGVLILENVIADGNIAGAAVVFSTPFVGCHYTISDYVRDHGYNNGDPLPSYAHTTPIRSESTTLSMLPTLSSFSTALLSSCPTPSALLSAGTPLPLCLSLPTLQLKRNQKIMQMSRTTSLCSDDEGLAGGEAHTAKTPSLKPIRATKK